MSVKNKKNTAWTHVGHMMVYHKMLDPSAHKNTGEATKGKLKTSSREKQRGAEGKMDT